MNIAKFCNAKFTLCRFVDLEFTNNPDAISLIEEGYLHGEYDKNLHEFYRTTVTKRGYCSGDIFADKIFFVEFEKSIIKITKFIQIQFDNCYFNFVVINVSKFKDVQFFTINFHKTLINSSDFNHVLFRKSTISESEFNRNLFNNIHFDDVKFDDCIFINCTFYAPMFYQCDLRVKFIDCLFVDWKGEQCTTSLVEKENFNFAAFRLLCSNCIFEDNTKARL